MRSARPNHRHIRVVLADTSRIHTQLMSEALQRDRGIEVVSATTVRSEVVDDVLEYSPDVAVISAMLEEQPKGGVSAVAEIKEKRAETRCVVLLDSSKADMVIEAFRAGADGVFCRDEPIKALCKCISVVHAGQIWANTSQLRVALNALAATTALWAPDTIAVEALSDRERDVVNGLAEGLTNREIADLLNISHHTVKNYMFRIFEKLGVSTRVELLTYVLAANSTKRPPHNGRADLKDRAATWASDKVESA